MAAMAQANGSKLLLMGRAGAGKTSMKSIIFANFLARDTKGLAPTNGIDYFSLPVLGKLRLNLWDCGGQDVFMENYFESQKETIFQNAQVLIYVISVSDRRGGAQHSGMGSQEMNKEMKYFCITMDSLREFSPTASVFVLIHKLDLVHETKREEVRKSYERDLVGAAKDIDITCFGTSIWDETLFKAWSQIVSKLIPDIHQLDQHLGHICSVCEADEVVLFEKNTFLLISHSTRKVMQDTHRFEKISNIVKQFKLSCGKVKTGFRSFQVKNSVFAAVIEPFIAHSFIMVVVSDPSVPAAATQANLCAARSYFSELASQGAGFGEYL